MLWAFKLSTASACSRNLACMPKVNSNTNIVVWYVEYLVQCISALWKLCNEVDENVM